MKQFTVILVALMLCSSAPVAAGEFADVMRKAQQSEEALPPDQMVKLVDAQADAMQIALTRCTPRGDTIPDTFAVVLRVNARGRVMSGWTRHGTPFETCFAEAMREAFRYMPPSTPFHTSIDYKRHREQPDRSVYGTD